MNNPLGVSPSEGKHATGNHTRQRKNHLTSVGIEPTTSGLDLPLLCRLPPMNIFALCGSLFPITRANAQWIIHGFK